MGLLFTGPKGEMWYGSTKDARICALKDSDGKPIISAQSPSLVAASKGGVFSWIYLRYISTKGSISMLKIEPVKELDAALGWK